MGRKANDGNVSIEATVESSHLHVAIKLWLHTAPTAHQTAFVAIGLLLWHPLGSVSRSKKLRTFHLIRNLFAHGQVAGSPAQV